MTHGVSGGVNQPKSGGKQSKVSTHPGRKEIETKIINNVPYSVIIKEMRRRYPEAPVLNATNLSNHRDWLMAQPITVVVENEDGTEEQTQAYLTGHHLATAVSIPQSAVPTDLPSLPQALMIIIAAGLQNIINNPQLVTPEKTLLAIAELRKMGGATDDLNNLMGAWGEVETRKTEQGKTARATRRTRTKTTTETVEQIEAVEPPAANGWDIKEVEALVLPAQTQGEQENQ